MDTIVRATIVGDHLVQIKIFNRVGPQPPQKRFRTVRLLTFARIFVQRILNDRMNGSLLPRRELMR